MKNVKVTPALLFAIAGLLLPLGNIFFLPGDIDFIILGKHIVTTRSICVLIYFALFEAFALLYFLLDKAGLPLHKILAYVHFAITIVAMSNAINMLHMLNDDVFKALNNNPPKEIARFFNIIQMVPVVIIIIGFCGQILLPVNVIYALVKKRKIA